MQGSRRVRYNRDHRFAADNLSAYIDGELTAGERARVERHLADCGDCRSDLHTLQATVNLMRAMPPRPAPRSFVLPAAARAVQARHRRWNAAFGALRGATVTIAMLFLLVLGGSAALSRGLLTLPGGVTTEAPMALMAPAGTPASTPVEDAAVPEASAPSQPYGATEGVQPTLAQAAPAQEQPEAEAERVGAPEAVDAPAPTDTARALQPPLETWPGPEGEKAAPEGAAGGAGGAGDGDPSAMGGVGGAGGGGPAMPTMPRSSGVDEGDEEPTAEAAAEALSADAVTPKGPTVAEAPSEKQAPTLVPQSEPTPVPTEASPEPPAATEPSMAATPEPTAESAPEALALERQSFPDDGAARGGTATDTAPLIHRESPLERALRAAPLAMALLAGLFLIVLAGTIWAGFKRGNT